MKVKIGHDYITRSGLSVRVICIDRKCDTEGPFQESPVVALAVSHEEGESVDFWRKDGHHATDFNLDLIDVSELLRNSLRVDDPVEVRSETGAWVVRHFAGLSISGILVWTAGFTSKTVPSCLARNTATRGAVEYTEYRPYKARR